MRCNMKKHIIAVLAVLMLGTAAIAQPADAACWWNGWRTVCRPAVGPGWWWRHHGWGWRHYWWGHRYWYPY
jgi:hypothetical protein